MEFILTSLAQKIIDLLLGSVVKKVKDAIARLTAGRVKDRCLEYLSSIRQKQFLDLTQGRPFIKPEIRELAMTEENPRAHKSILTINVQSMVTDQKNYVMASNSGMGKTTFLRWIELSISKGELPATYLPVYLHCRRLQNCRSSDALIEDLVSDFAPCGRTGRLRESLNILWEKGYLLFLVDGLDQVPEETHFRDHQKTEKLFGRNKIILATWPSGYYRLASESSRYLHVEIALFNLVRIEDYLASVLEKHEIRCLLRLLGNGRELLRIPILLKMVSELTEDWTSESVLLSSSET
jgi:predicted NACHT family NTPase